MITSKELADLLSTVNLSAVSRQCGVSHRTLMRLKNQEHDPGLSTVHKIVAAASVVAETERRRVEEREALKLRLKELNRRPA